MRRLYRGCPPGSPAPRVLPHPAAFEVRPPFNSPPFGCYRFLYQRYTTCTATPAKAGPGRQLPSLRPQRSPSLSQSAGRFPRGKSCSSCTSEASCSSFPKRPLPFPFPSSSALESPAPGTRRLSSVFRHQHRRFRPRTRPEPPPPAFQIEDFEPYVTTTISTRVNRLIGHYGFTSQDRDDLSSDLRTHFFSKIPHYSPSRGARTSFVAEVVLNRMRSIVEARKTALRLLPVGFSLDERLEDEDGLETGRSEFFDHDDYLVRAGRRDRPDRESRELTHDVNQVIARLSPDLADLCQRLKTQTVREISDETGVPKSTIHYRLIRLRKLFEVEGLHGYVAGRPSIRRPRL